MGKQFFGGVHWFQGSGDRRGEPEGLHVIDYADFVLYIMPQRQYHFFLAGMASSLVLKVSSLSCR